MVTEIELKYSLLDSNDASTTTQVNQAINQLLDKHGFSFTHQTKQLSNYYFDTPNLALRKSRIALRTRGTQNTDNKLCFEQTIKTSGTVIAGLHQRPEYNVDIDNSHPDISLFPHSLWQDNTDIAQLQKNIIELFSTNFTRNTWLVDVGSSQVEIAFDSGEIACQGHTNKPRIYEIELELVKGDTQALFVLTQLLFSQLALRPGQLTKAARGYALNREKNSLRADSKLAVKEVSKVDENWLPIISYAQTGSVNEAFSSGVAFALEQLQLSIDNYVGHMLQEVDAKNACALINSLNKIYDWLLTINNGFTFFEDILFLKALPLTQVSQDQSSNENVLEKGCDINVELRFFINTIASINRLDKESKHSDILAIFHSERFNNVQLSLLSLLLRLNDTSCVGNPESFSLRDLAFKHLNDQHMALNTELNQYTQLNLINESNPPKELSTEIMGLLDKTIASTSWFGHLFAEEEKVNEYCLPLLALSRQGNKSNIASLESVNAVIDKVPYWSN